MKKIFAILPHGYDFHAATAASARMRGRFGLLEGASMSPMKVFGQRR
jgi:hypothetical protein